MLLKISSTTGLLNKNGKLFSVVFGTSEPSVGSPVANLTASRITGTAPLSVFFDATGSLVGNTGTRAFHDLLYSFDYGDLGSGNWSETGQSKNTDWGGPLGAHVFETAGTFEVRVRATASDGLWTEATVLVNVSDPNVVYAGSNTICVSPTGNWAGAPAGSLQVTSVPSPIDSNKRVLLQRGATFGPITIGHGRSGVQVGAFGSGAKPVVNSVTIGQGRPPTPEHPENNIVMDLRVQDGLYQNSSARRITFLRCDVNYESTTLRSQIDIAAGLEYWAGIDPWREIPPNSFYNPHEIFIVECVVLGTNSSGSATNGNLFSSASRLVVMGCDLGKSNQHTIRLFKTHKTFIAHNRIRGIGGGAQHAIKIHSGGFNEYNDNYAISGDNWFSDQIVIVDNYIGDTSDNNTQTCTVRPQNAGENANEGIRNVIIERNRMRRGSFTSADIILCGSLITTRGNVLDGSSGSVSIFVVNPGDSGYDTLPPEWKGPYFIF